MSVHLPDWGLRQLTADEWLLHDRLLIALRSRWRDGYRRTLPILRRTR